MSTWAVQQRLRFIDFLLAEYGTINRSALMDYYGMSVVQASHDLRAYGQLAPTNMAYDAKVKTYRRTAQFKRVWS